MKVVPSVPNFSNSPLLGIIVNSASLSGVKEAVNGANYFLKFVSLKETEEVLLRGDYKTILSSSLGGLASRDILYFHLPPAYLTTLKSIVDLKGLFGSNIILYSSVSLC